MNAKEELTTMLMESYDRGVEDAKQEALAALEKTVAVMVAAEREAIIDLVAAYGGSVQLEAAIRARGKP